ncbi:MAG: hypothetical protein ACYSUX_04015, partial [Planctomycetota bacterium]
MTYNPSEKKKPIVVAAGAVFALVVIGALLRGIFSSPASSRQQLGLLSLSTTDENGDKWVLDLVKGQSLSSLTDSSSKTGPPLLVKTD